MLSAPEDASMYPAEKARSMIMYRIGVIELDGHQGVILEGIARRDDACLAAVSSGRPGDRRILRTVCHEDVDRALIVLSTRNGPGHTVVRIRSRTAR